MEMRTERIVIETNRHRIVGDLSLPAEGYRSRFSDYLNREDVAFIPLTDATVAPLDGTSPEQLGFIAVAREHVILAYPAPE